MLFCLLLLLSGQVNAKISDDSEYLYIDGIDEESNEYNDIVLTHDDDNDDSEKKPLWNTLSEIENTIDDHGEGSTEKGADTKTTETQIGAFTTSTVDYFTENENNTDLPPNNSSDSKISILWINATYQAYDFHINVTLLDECIPWMQSGSRTNASNDSFSDQIMNDTDATNWTLPSLEMISSKGRLRELGLDANLLQQYQDELHPSEEKLQHFAQVLNEIIQNSTSNSSFEMGPYQPEFINHIEPLSITPHTLLEQPRSVKKQRHKRSFTEFLKKTPHGDDDVDDDGDGNGDHDSRKTSWITIHDKTEDNDLEEEIEVTSDDYINQTAPVVIEIDAAEQQARMTIRTWEAARALRLNIPKHLFTRHQVIGLLLDGICADFVPTAIDEFNAAEFSGVDIDEPIGLNVTALAVAGVNLTELAGKLRNDTEVDMILSRTASTNGTFGGSFILPVLQKNKYDPFTAPIVFQGSAVVVRFGIYIESMSNFQTSTMDYEMDIFLMMAWRDARLVNPYKKAILVKEEEILEKIWRPDPFFANAKEASFHEVTFLNFLMRIYNDGLVLYETRIKLKPSCNLVLCKYPHDKQTCELRIKSFAYPTKIVRFEWFSNKRDAIDKNPDVTLPELYVDRYEPTYCKRTRKTGYFSCLRAVFRLKRDVGYHMAQTYIPTSLALMFSWVGVWLPEEFMEGRIGVAITVLLTLSTESAGAREHLPSVSYMKAIDLWFGFITGFVFITLLQTLIVIALDKRANQLRKWAAKKRRELTEQSRELLLARAERHHKRGRYLDNFCRVFYPLAFLIFLIAYYFVFTEGRQDDCVFSGQQT